MKTVKNKVFLKLEKALIISFLMWVVSFSIIAQNTITVEGNVKDSNGDPLPGVTVVVKGTSKGTITNINGSYILTDTPSDGSLQFSFIGMTTQEVAINNRKIINVIMEEESVYLEEVVAVGYGYQKRASITGSVATVNADKISIAPVASTTNALAGRLPGLITKQEMGLPGRDNASLSIRGFGAPLVIVDGVESGFNNIDPNEIESISILKDASAAIYGARAGDGVILVTTKRGKSGKPVITINSSISLQEPTYMPKRTSSGQLAELLREDHTNRGLPEANQRFTQEEVDLFYAGTDPDYPNTDWYKISSNRFAPQHQHNFSIRGGTETIKYYGFLGYLSQETVFKNAGEYQRFNLRSNVDAQILPNLNAQVNISSIWEDRDFAARVYSEGIGGEGAWGEYWNSEPFYASSLPDPDKIAYSGTGGAISLPFMTDREGVGYRKYYSNNNKININLEYDFNFVKGLSAKASAYFNENFTFEKLFNRGYADSFSYNYSNDTYTQHTTSKNPDLRHQDNKSRAFTGQFMLNYDRTLDKDHEVKVMALYELINTSSDWISAGRSGYKSDIIEYLFAGSVDNQTADGRASEMGRQSYIGRLNYAYKHKYLVEATLRMDESAKFHKDHRRGVFPSVSLGWRLSEEGFLKSNFPVIENLKLRASYSQTGKDAVGNFQYLAGYQYNMPYIYGDNTTVSLVETGLPNPLLTWETMTIYNGGIDFSISRGVLYGEFDVFYRLRDGIPGRRTQSLPSTFGATLPLENLNAINTRGFEAVLGHEGYTKDFRWNVRTNISWSRSKWDYFDEPAEWENPDQERQEKRTGQWTDRRFGYVSDGLFTNLEEIDALDYVYNETQGNIDIKPGDIKYLDTNGDGLLDWKDQVEIGQGTMPHWIYGLNVDLVYKNFELSTFFQGAFGFTINNTIWPFSLLAYQEAWTETWRDNNRKDALLPRLGGAGSNNWASDFRFKKGDYLRLKTLQVGYNIPKSIVKKINIQNLKVFATALNLFTISELTKYSIDPEAPSGQGGNYYPQMRAFNFGLNISL